MNQRILKSIVTSCFAFLSLCMIYNLELFRLGRHDGKVIGWKEKNGPPNTKVNFSCNKRPNLTTKFGVLGFLCIDNLQQKFGGSISKIVDFFLMSNFC